MRIFLAGATGAVGRRLVPMLVAAGHAVTGTTRSAARAGMMEAMGATPAIVDAFDRDAVISAVAHARPNIVVHQLTDLPQAFDPAAVAASLAGNARLRQEGTHNLVDAALSAGARRLVAQSLAFVYAPGPEPHGEGDPLDASEAQAVTIAGVQALESAVTGAAGIEGLVLRYGRFYGPGTWGEAPGRAPAVHVDTAARAAFLALTRGRPGIYNIADADGAVSIEKAQRELGFDPAFRLAGA